MAGIHKKEKQESEGMPAVSQKNRKPDKPVEIGGPGGPEPTRYGDWERRGRCIDF